MILAVFAVRNAFSSRFHGKELLAMPKLHVVVLRIGM